MYLIAGDDRHLLREGITLIGSVENDRYNCIKLQCRSICPKHAALRWCSATKDLHVMDLCSHGGTQLENDFSAKFKEIRPLEWHKSSIEGTIMFGTFKARLESSHNPLRKRSLSFFVDEDSTDFVDCSLEEPPQIKSRTESKKLLQSNTSCTSVNTTTGNAAVPENNSFLIPATQPMNSTSANSSNLPQANDSQACGNITTEDDEDDIFYIPETQEQQEHSITEQIIDPIVNTIGLAEAEKDDDYLRFETQDDENTGDGMFNNPYVEQSQNLLHNLDESYQKNSARSDQRKSILPDRSVDSISFHGKIKAVDTTDDLSKLEWNDTKSAENPSKTREGSLTPELAFDKPTMSTRDPPLAEEPCENVLTPDLEFDRITPQPKELTADASRLSLAKLTEEVENHRQQSTTPDLNFDHLSGENDDEAEISLNQEGAVNPYDLQTQPILAEPYDPATKKMHIEQTAYEQMPTKDKEAAGSMRNLSVGLFNLKSSMKDVSFRINKQIDLNPFEMATQPLPANEPEDVYELQTQLLPRASANDPPTQEMPTQDKQAAGSMRNLSVGLFNIQSSMKDVSFRINKQIDLNPFEMATQPLPANEPEDVFELQTQLLPRAPNDTIPLELPPASSKSKIKRHSSSKRQRITPEIDPLTMATQPLTNHKSKNMYDLQTQPLLRENDQNDTIPLDIILQSPSRSPSEAYNLQTQPLTAKDSHTSLGDEDPDMSKLFLPKVNSTYRQSILAKQIINQKENDEENENKDDANISPSSNKENRVKIGERDPAKLEAVKLKANILSLHESETLYENSQPTDECLDDEYCLAATLPVTDSSSKRKTTDSSHEVTSSTKRDKRPDRKKDPIFKVPNSSAASSTKSSVNTGMETPRAKKCSSSDQSVETDTFDFNTPEHPFLNATKRDKILAISDIITSRTTQTNRSVQRNKYIFGDSSDEDEDPTLPVFLKEDSKLRVMKYDLDENGKKETKAKPKPETERRSKREQKRETHQSDDDYEDKRRTKREQKRETHQSDDDYEDTRRSKRAQKRDTRQSDDDYQDTRRSKREQKRETCQSDDEYEKGETNAGKIKTDRKKKPEDESIEYKPPTEKPSRKRKVAEVIPEPAPSSKSGKSSKTTKSEPEPKAGPSSRIEEKSSTRSRSKRGEQAIAEVVPVVEDERRKQRGKTNKPPPSKANTDSSEDESPVSATTNKISPDSDSSVRARKSSRVSKPRLMFTKMSPEPYRQIITRSGGLIVDIPELATVLVSDRVYRTCKFLCAIAKGIPIVGQSYLEATDANHDFVDPWDYILQDREMERRFKFNLKKSLTLARESKILQDYSVIITPSIMPPPEELQMIVTSAGGRVIKFSSQQPRNTDKILVVSDVRDKNMWPKFRERYPSIEIIATEGLMLSIMQHFKNFRSYRLT